MKTEWKEHAWRLILTLLLSLGLLLPLLHGMELPFHPAGIFFIILLFSSLLEAISLNRRFLLTGLLVLSSFFLIWLLFGGLGILLDLTRAISLQLSGIDYAVPLLSGTLARVLAVMFTLLCFFCSRKGAGGVPALLLCVSVLLLIWLADRFELIWFHLPALIAALMLLMMDRHPELSPARILPWLAGLSLLCVLLTPPSGIVAPGLKEKADHLRQQILDRLFYTEPRDVFSLMNEGYYPQGIGQLGGKATPRDVPVMQVSTSRPVYLRGVALNEYDGRSWRNTLGGRRYLWSSPSSRQNRIRLFNQDLPPEGLSASLLAPGNVSVRMLASGASTVFVPQRIRDLQVGGELVPYFSNSSELFITRNLQAGDTWSVSAPMLQAGDAGLSILIRSAEEMDDPLWENILETYTRLPSHLEEPVWQMALDVTSPHETNYDKAFALQSFLSRSYRYTLDVAAQPSNIDFVTNFLFNTGEGYCTYFASAMTILCRMAGLPARYIEGYLALPDAHGEAIVTGLNAHAWTEVYFKGFGWVTFDATPRSASANGNQKEKEGENAGQPDAASPSDSPAEPTVTPGPDSSVQPTPEAQESVSPEPESTGDPVNPEESMESAANVSMNIPLMILLILLLAFMAGLLFRWIATDPDRLGRKAADDAERFSIWLHEVALRLNARKLVRRPGETPMTYTWRLDTTADLPLRLSKLGESVSLCRYGQAVPAPKDVELVRSAARALKKGQNLSARLRYLTARLKPGKQVHF